MVRFAGDPLCQPGERRPSKTCIKCKNTDYFAAGTVVVWDVDGLPEECVRVYRASDPENPTIYRRGETAEAEPAVPGWTFVVDELFLLEEPR